MRFVAGFFLVVACLVGSTAQVSAATQASTVVLGLRSLEGDDDFANQMTEGLRGAAKGVTGWRLIERSVSMAQMTLAHSCDEVDAACLNDIAKGLEAERVVFGTVRRTAARGKFDYEITVSVFNATTHTIVDTQSVVVPKVDSKVKKSLSGFGQTLVSKLAAADSNAGQFMILVNVSAAEVNIDGKWVGRTQDGKLSLDNLEPGEHTLEVSAGGHQLRTQRIVVSTSERSSVNVTLEPFNETPTETTAPPEAVATTDQVEDTSHSSLSWLGFTLIGVGAASAIAWGGTMYYLEFGINQDRQFQQYKAAYGNQQIDTCDAALNSAATLNGDQLADFQGKCRTGRTLQLLQWVFLGAAVITGGAGAYVLVSESSSEHAQARLAKKRAFAQAQPSRLAVMPVVQRHVLGVEAKLTF